MSESANDLENRIMELAGIGDDEGIVASGDSSIALRTAALVFGMPSAVFLRNNGNYAARFVKSGISVNLEFAGMHKIFGTVITIPNPPLNNDTTHGGDT